MSLPTATEILLAYDAARPRSQQAEVGMSQLGACRRQTGYMLRQTPPDEDFRESGTQAILGTAIHEVLAEGLRLLVPEAHAEKLTVHFGGLMGHPDVYHDGVLRDYKTLGYGMQVESRRQRGPQQRERWQAHTYAAALIIGGFPVHTVQLDYIARDSSDEYLFEEPFDATAVAAAMNWLEDVRVTPVEQLERDYRPDSKICANCKFFRRCWDAERGTDDRHVLFVDDPDVAAWAMRLQAAQAVRKRAEQDEADARGALDTLRTISRPGQKQDVAVPGLDKVIRFSMRKGRTSPDMAQIAMAYKRADPGARPPMKTGEPTVGITLVKPKKETDGPAED
jgi:hypothetical protein